MIVRDINQIIVQHDSSNPSKPPDSESGGDSLSRTGIMALCGSELDQGLLWSFKVPGLKLLVRHPFQQKWNDPLLTSRDQVVCGVSSGLLPMSALYYASTGRVNKDILDPGVRLYLYKCSGVTAPLWIRILGKVFLHAAMIWNTKIKPNEEMNQFACICIVMGPEWAQRLYQWHPDIEANIRAYWEYSWRDQAEIAQALVKTLRKYLI